MIKKLVAEESKTDNNWNKDKWTIIDKSKCPKAAMIKKDLDKLDTKGAFGINRNENRVYWLNVFSEKGEAGGLAQVRVTPNPSWGEPSL